MADSDRWHPDDDVLVEVALGEADAAMRQDVAAHLVLCGRCRAAYGELAGAIEQTLCAVPRVAPPADFEAAALARIEAEAGALEVPAVARRPAVRRWLVPLAAALVGIAAGAGIVAVTLDDPSAASVTAATPLVTAGGERVGDVTRTISADGPALVVALQNAPTGSTYTCRLVLADGSVRDVGTWAIYDDGVHSWVVGDDDAQRVELIDESGKVWSSAEL